MRLNIVGMDVDVTSSDDVVRQLDEWIADENVSTYVCVSNVHMAMEALDDPRFRGIVNAADMTLPDSRIVAWAQQLLGAREAEQVYGPDITLTLCEHAAKTGTRVGFYGGSPDVIAELQRRLPAQCPGLSIVYAHSPPFRALTEAEDAAVVEAINAARVQWLFVGLGCPKQEFWMASHKGRIRSVMLGVGAAFDFLAGTKTNPPRFVRSIGLGWLFRLVAEPKRLWKRYLKHNPRFVWYFGRQLLRQKLGKT